MVRLAQACSGLCKISLYDKPSSIENRGNRKTTPGCNGLRKEGGSLNHGQGLESFHRGCTTEGQSYCTNHLTAIFVPLIGTS